MNRVRTNSLWGTQSRTKHTTSAPAATSFWTSQAPTRPVPPVTNVGLSSQKEVSITPTFSMAHFPPSRRFPTAAYLATYPYIARSHDGHTQPTDFLGLIARGHPLPNSFHPSQYNPGRLAPSPLIHPSPICGFSVNWAIRSPSKISPPNRAGGRTAVSVTIRPHVLCKASRASKSTFDTPSP